MVATANKPPMTFSEALRYTLFEYGITAQDLALAADVHPNRLYGFKNGKAAINSDALERIVRALPADARKRFLALCLEECRDNS